MGMTKKVQPKRSSLQSVQNYCTLAELEILDLAVAIDAKNKRILKPSRSACMVNASLVWARQVILDAGQTIPGE